MKFGPVAPAEAVGALLAHSVRLPDGALKKGARVSAADAARMAAAGLTAVTVARLEPTDAPEDAAAERVLAALAPDPTARGLERAAPFTGRANLYAAGPGLFRLDAGLVDAVNAVDPAITLATLPDATWVGPRRMLATVKIIPYAAPVAAVASVERLLAEAAPERLPRLASPRLTTAGFVMTRTPGLPDKQLAKGEAVVRARLAALGVETVAVRVAAHETEALAAALADLPGAFAVVLAASATTDPRDVAPEAIRRAGGVVERVGMPVDPGNLMVVGRIGARPAVCLPGCAKSPAPNGADFVLERIVTGEPVDAATIARMGVGGLLKEIASRPSPRVGVGTGEGPTKPFVAGVLLAAGGSTRLGEGRHKLLEPIDGRPLLRHVAERLLASRLDALTVVLGARAGETRAALSGLPPALSGLPVAIVEALDWSAGQSASLRAGLAAVAARADAAVIALADMPEVGPRLVDRLIAAFDAAEGREIVRPVSASGRPGHPVLFGRRFFEALGALEGDVGARAVIEAHGEFLTTIEAEDEAPTIDLDTAADWAAWRAATAG